MPSQPEVTVSIDVSGRWGCGAFTDRGEWFRLRWPTEWEDVHITGKELLPIVCSLCSLGISVRLRQLQRGASRTA